MNYYSTVGEVDPVSFQEAIFKGLPDDNGLFMPNSIPVLTEGFWSNIENFDLKEIAFEISKVFIDGEIPDLDLKNIINIAADFDAPLVSLTESLFCLELFHGPSMAFKDFGARFMAGIMSYFLEQQNKKINILVATSGDTGGAVAQGFYDKKNISVNILYPKAKVSEIQELQLTTLGKNITAFEIDGTFDDCQALVKQAFLDKELNKSYVLASANSINIARLIPQAFYYVYAYSKLKSRFKNITFIVPSGNFGNLTAGIFAYKMGMKNVRFLAATNANNVVPEYLSSGTYKIISPSIATISNAMDVGNPSNFPRLKNLFKDDLNSMRLVIDSAWYNDEETRNGILELYKDFNYIACPHTAIAYLASKNNNTDNSTARVFLATAHYGKFLPEMESVLNFTPELPDRLSELRNKSKVYLSSSKYFPEFKSILEASLIY